MSTTDSADIALLQTIGTGVMRSFVAVVVETFGVAIYTVLVVKASTILLKKDKRRRIVTQVMFILILALYAMRLCLWIIDIHNIVNELDLTLVSRQVGDSLEDRYSRSGKSERRLGLVEDVLYAYMVLLGDAIIFSRVYAFWHIGKEKLVLVLPCLVFVGTTVLTALVNFCASNPGANLEFGAFTHPAICLNVQITSYWFQFVTAVVAASLIGLKTWKFRQMIKPLMERNEQMSPLYKVMIIILDSGILYMLFFTVEAVLSLQRFSAAIHKHAGLSFALTIYQYQTSSIVGIYPTLVVILVHSQLTLVDQNGNTTCLTTVRFGTRPHSRPSAVVATGGTFGWINDAPAHDDSRIKLSVSGGDGAELNMHEIRFAQTAAMTSRGESETG